MKSIKFSVVIPAYNAEKFITKCLDSVKEQTYKNYEVIIVNDGSKDDTDVVVKKYISEHPDMNFKYLEQKNGGAAIARGSGINLAEGDYIALLDSDDMWYPKKLETDAAYIEKYEAEVYYNSEYEVNVYGKKRKCDYFQLGGEPMVELITGANPISTSTVVVQTDFMKRNHSFFDGNRYGEDIACWIALAKAGARFKHIPVILGEYVRQENSLTMNDADYMDNTYKRLLSFLDDLADCGYEKEQIEALRKKQEAIRNYNMARFYHRKADYAEAKKYYKQAIGMNVGNKAKAGYILAMFHINK